MSSKNKIFYKEFKAAAILVAIFGALILTIQFLLVNDRFSFFMPFFLIYVTISVTLSITAHFLKNKIVSKISSIVVIPLPILFAALIFIVPFFTLAYHIIFYFFLASALPLFIWLLADQFFPNVEISMATISYIVITSVVFIAVLMNPVIREILYSEPLSRIKTSKKLKPFALGKLTDELLSLENIKFLVYSSYVFVLVLINILNFQGNTLLGIVDMDKSVLQSFVTFIAFDRSLTLLKALKFRPSTFLTMIVSSIHEKIEKMKIKDGSV